MPTKINSLSPFTLNPATIISLGIKQKQGQQEAIQDYAKEVRQDLGVEEGQKGLFGGLLRSDQFKDLSVGEKAGIYGKGLLRSFLGGLGGVTGMDLTPNSSEENNTTKYTTNINPMTGEEIPNKMDKPFKALSPYTASYSAYNMSAKQANSEEKMKQISGADSALQTNAFMGALRYAQENNKPTFKVGGEVHDNKDYDPNKD